MDCCENRWNSPKATTPNDNNTTNTADATRTPTKSNGESTGSLVPPALSTSLTQVPSVGARAAQ